MAPTALKKQHSDASTARTAKQETIKTKQAKLTRDLGPELQYSQMDGNCVEKEASKFTYKICAFEKVEQ